MAKKDNKAENPQENSGAPVPVEQETQQANVDENVASEQPQDTERTALASTGNDDKKATAEKKKQEPKVSDAVTKIGKSLLKSNPEMSVVYMTSDGRGFYMENDAENHARTLNNKAVTPVKR